jgi:uncharacterized 2Fe-2S/4Fe-4S cluster protein (DUF4445 family)
MQRKILFQPMGILAVAEEGETILQAASGAGVHIEAYCGSRKTCGKCKVRILSGAFSDYAMESSMKNVSPVSASEERLLKKDELDHGFRLACTATIAGDVAVEIPKDGRTSEEVILETGKDKETECNPAVRNYYVELDKATLKDNVNDFTRLKEALACKYKELEAGLLEIDYYALKKLSKVIRAGSWRVCATVLHNKKIIDVEQGISDKQIYGVAIDIGTTTIAAYLCSLEDGRTKQTVSMMNPQIRFGDDVLSRISYCADHENGVDQLQKLLMEGLNELIRQMAEQEGIHTDRIVEAVLVFNTVMEHIALGISPDHIGVAPFVSTVAEPVDIMARDLGLQILPGGNVHCLPSEAGFVGADNVAVLISEEPYLQDKMKLIIDIGTNSELCLGNRDGIYTTSCATGPALEGAQIQCGMRACRGAIEKIAIDPVTLEPVLGIIGSNSIKVPTGICGSGIIDAISQMASAGIIEPDGKFSKNITSDRVRNGQDGKKEYVLYFKKGEDERDIVVTQKDVRAVQLAKAALYAGAKALMNSCGIEKPDEIILAGAFGSYIDKKNALALGLFPDCPLDSVKVVGNAAGLGAKLALVNIGKRKEAENIARQVKFIETAMNQDYQVMFARAMAIPHEKDSFALNQPYIWPCMGKDDRANSQEVLNMGAGLINDFELMDRAVIENKRAENRSYLLFPIMQKIEAVAYGGEPEVVGHNIIVPDYVYQKLEQIDFSQSILEHRVIQNTLECIFRHSGDRIILEVTGPFSILAALVNPTKLYSYYRKNKALLIEVLHTIADSLAEYTIEAIKRGVRIISFADSEGVTELVGEPFYREISGAATAAYLKKLEGHLDHALVHLCGKTSYSLQRAGYITTKIYRAGDKEYMELLFDYAENKKFKFIGHNCIHTRKLSVPLISKLELTN